MKLRKLLTLTLAVVMTTAVFTGCGSDKSSGENAGTEGTEAVSEWDATNDITVVSREDGSGTRGAFIELFGIEQKDAEGKKVDYTTVEATITNNTEVMMQTVSGNEYAIGYVSLGSLSNDVKAVKIDGAEATEENIKNGTYKVFRPFNIATKGEISDIAQDFINYILSEEGQKVVSDNGYIALDGAKPFESNGATGKVVVAGSSSVTPVMEKLKEAYLKVNLEAEVEINQSDSTTGMTNTMEGICDIGMASRELKEEELAELTPIVIANDGIAVIVNKESTVDELSSEDVKTIFTGEAVTWDEIVK
ncbi:MAG: substrate-binding domain-containing protein [bacterium]|nr:substrate-binding domain-containing protein [bacterium]